MRSIFRSTLSFAVMFGAVSGIPAGKLAITSGAHAASAPANNVPLTLKILKVTGNQAIATSDILAALPYQAGSTVTRDQLDAGVQKVIDLYKAKNIGAKFGERERFVKNTVQFYITIEEAAPTAAPAPAALVIRQINFVGNKKISTADLEAVTKLRAGSPVSTEAVTADESAIQEAYKKKNIGVQIQPSAAQPEHDNNVVLTYQITEQ